MQENTRPSQFKARMIRLSRVSAILTPFGIREARKMRLDEIEEVFGPGAADFVEDIRRHKIRGVRI